MADVVAVALAAGWLVWALLRLSGAERGFPLVPAMSFTRYVTALSWLPVLVGALADSPLAVIMGSVAAVALLAGALPAVLGRARSTHPDLRIGSLNMLHGRADPATVRRLSAGLDVLALQELTVAGLQALLDAGLDEDFPHRLCDVEMGTSTGGAVLAREPLRAQEPVPGNVFRQPRATVANVDLTSVHLWPPASSPAAVRTWLADLALLPAPAPGRVLAGDFNATLDHAAFRRLLRAGWTDAASRAGRGLRLTWYAGGLIPGLTIDHVLLGPGLSVVNYAVHRVPGSDHRMLVVSLQVGSAPRTAA